MVTFRKTARLLDFDMPATVDIPAGRFVEVATMTIPAQQMRYFGNGGIINGVDDRGTFTLDLNTSVPAAIPGTCRLVVSDANRVRRVFLREDRSEDLAAAAGGVQLGFTTPGAKQDSLLIIEYMADTAATATSADSAGSIPLTYTAL